MVLCRWRRPTGHGIADYREVVISYGSRSWGDSCEPAPRVDHGALHQAGAETDVTVANALADAGLEPRRHYFVILDELWRALRAGRGMVDRVDALTCLNRQRGVGLATIPHTMSDLLALPTEAERMKARGFVEHAGMVIAGGLPSAEMSMLTSAIPLSKAEQDLLISWQDPPAWDSSTGREAEPPGRGKFLVKVGGNPGTSLKVQLMAMELAVNDTNRMWHAGDRLPPVAPERPDLIVVLDSHRADGAA